METRPRDTSPEMWERQIALLRAMSPAQRLDLAGNMRQTVLDLALAGIRLRHPGASERECTMRLRLLTLGRELAERVYPEIAALGD